MSARKFDHIKHDHFFMDADGILTEWKFYQKQKAEHTDVIILMRHYETYSVLGDDADRVAPLLEDVLTHKDAGRMYCYDTENYSYHSFSFGQHNLHRAMDTLIQHDMRVAISDFDMAFKEWGGWQRADKMIAEAERKREAERPKVWVQTSLFDMEGFA